MPTHRLDPIDRMILAELQAETGARVLEMSGVSKEGVTQVLRALWAQIAAAKPKSQEDTPWTP